MYLSGTLGFELFKFTINGKTKYILLLSDMHSGVKYCDKQSNNISEFLKSREINSNVLLEESTQKEEVKTHDIKKTITLEDLTNPNQK